MTSNVQDAFAEEPGTRILPRVWERHRETILSLYEDHSLVEVMAHMQREYNFTATKMAYKKKLGRWKAGKQANPVHHDPLDDAEREPEEQIDSMMIDIDEDAGAALRLSDKATKSRRQELPDITQDKDKLTELHKRLPVSLLGTKISMQEPNANAALCEMFKEYARNKQIFEMERILSLFDFISGPHSVLFCSLVLRFCRIACECGVISAKHAGMYVAALDGFLDNKWSFLLDDFNLPETLKCLVEYWLRNLIYVQRVSSTIDKLSSFYEEYDKEDGLHRLVPYLELCKQCTLDDECDAIRWQCMEKLLEVIHQEIQTPTGMIKVEFISKYLDFLWDNQQGPKTFIAQEGLINLYHLMRDATYLGSAYHTIFVACILIQAYWRDISDPPEREPFVSARIDEMERKLPDISLDEGPYEKLKQIQNLLSIVAADARKCQSRIRDTQFASIAEIRARLAKFCWDVWCAKAKSVPLPAGPCESGVTTVGDENISYVDLNNPGIELVDAPMPKDDTT